MSETKAAGDPAAPGGSPAARLVRVQPGKLRWTTPRVPTETRQEEKKSFRLIRSGIDVQPFLAELVAGDDLWLADTSRQDKIAVQRHTQTIALRMADSPRQGFDPREVHESRYSRHAGRFPLTLAFVQAFAREVGGALARVMLVRLAPHSSVGRHIDTGAYYACRDRYHLVIRSHGSVLEAGGEQVTMNAGELWWFDNKQPHEALNASDEWRVHLIFDIEMPVAPDGRRGEPRRAPASGVTVAASPPAESPTVRLRELIRQHAVVTAAERRILSPQGRPQDWILDIRATFLNGEAVDLLTDLFWQRFRALAPCQVAGLEMGAVPLVGALVQKARQLGIEANGLLIRKSRNKHGLQKIIEGVVTSRPTIIVDDLVNSASSLEKVRVTLADHGCPAVAAFVVVDFRTEQSRRWQESTGIGIHGLYALDEFGLKFVKKLRADDGPPFAFRTVWSYRATGTPDLFTVVARATPAIGDQRVFVGTSAAEFAALDLHSGEPLWRFATGRQNPKGITSSPSVCDGRVFFGAYDGNVYALNTADGSPAWMAQVADYVGSSPALAPDLGLVFIGLEHETPGRKGSLAALEIESGRMVWQVPTREYLHATPAYCAERGLVAVGTNDDDFVMANARSGQVLWRRPLGGQVKMAPCFSLKHNVICVGAMDGSFSILDMETGDVRATIKADTGIYTTPLIVEDRAFFCSTDKRFYVVDLNEGKLVTRIDTRARCFSSPTLIDGRVYFGNNAGTVFELDLVSLKPAGQHQLPDRVVSAVAYSPQSGYFYAHTSDARVFAFARQEAAAS